MMNPTAESARWIQLRHGDDDKQVLVITEDGDRFVLPVEMAVRACKSMESMTAYLEQLGTVLGRLRRWLSAHGEDVDRAYLIPRESRLLFVVVRKTIPHNESLSGALADLDLAIAQDDTLPMIDLSVLDLPRVSDDGLRSFLDPSKSLTLAPSHAE